MGVKDGKSRASSVNEETEFLSSDGQAEEGRARTRSRSDLWLDDYLLCRVSMYR